LPALKKYAHNLDYCFLDADELLRETRMSWPLFIKPVKGNKAFSGNVFTKEKFQEEYNFFVRNLNIDPYIICQYSPPKPIEKEYRFVIVNNDVIDGCQYLENGERIDKPCDEPSAKELASVIANHLFFINFPNFVVDIAQNDDTFTLLEVNSIHTSSFYSCDLDKIYSTLANYYS
jgi:glutathione synthase/RimK-type ligase-like ATP-grasp enzyme